MTVISEYKLDNTDPFLGTPLDLTLQNMINNLMELGFSVAQKFQVRFPVRA